MRHYAVIIPTRDRSRAKLLAQAVDSVLGQTLPPAEVIVVSDGPAGAVREALANRPVKIVERPAQGEARARNAGIAAATAEWICFLDDDDLWHPDFLRTTDEFLGKNNEITAVNASYWTFAPNGGFGADLSADDLAGCLAAADKAPRGSDTSYMQICGRSFELLLERLRGDIDTVAVRRDIVEKADRFTAGFTYANDWLFFVNVARFVEWHYIPERLAFRRQHAGRTTRTQVTNGVEILRVLHHMWAEESLPTPAHRPLAAYGRDYRFRVQETLWGAIRSRRADLTWRALSLGMPLLPSWRDRAYALTPRQLTWRLERMSAAFTSGARPGSAAGQR
jgi:glycosyltransferase involved in cell wall biosynthesis